VVRRTGKFGPYVSWTSSAGPTTLNCTPDDTIETLTPRLRAKVSPTEGAVDRIIGVYRIKRGPYGLYMYKIPPTGSTTKPKFVGIPDTTPWSTLTLESAEEIYKHAVATANTKKSGVKR
jgi:topoisomerase IA-like protein